MACFNRPLLCSVCSSICLVLKKSGRKARLHVSCMHVIIISPLKAQLIKFFYLLFQYNGITNTVRTTLLNIVHGNLFDFQLLEESEFCFSFLCLYCVSVSQAMCFFFVFVFLERFFYFFYLKGK